jgi:two-component system cell cycle response regulator DivK
VTNPSATLGETRAWRRRGLLHSFTRRGSEGMSNLDRFRILLVEDFDDARELYSTCLRSSGYEVIEAATGIEAVALARSASPDLILMDLLLPGMDGWQATAELKRDPRVRHVPIVALTAHALSDERERIARLGCDAFLAKPCLPPDLIRTVDRILGRPTAPPEAT